MSTNTNVERGTEGFERKTVRDEQGLSTLVDERSLVVVHFGAEWCAASDRVADALAAVAADVGAALVDVDVERRPVVSQVHDVARLPTVDVYRDGERVDRLEGPRDEAQLRRAVDAAR